MVCSSSATTTTSSHSSINVTTSSSLSGIGSPNASSMFAGVDSFLPDYDSSLYSLWNAPGAYDTENDATQGQQQQVQPPLYMTPEDELKMDYPQLPEFNQDLDSYLNDAMDSGGHSPPTSTGNNHGGMMKMDHLVTTDRRTGAGASSVGAVGAASLTTGTQFERLLAPATSEYLEKRERGVDQASERAVKRSRGVFDDTYAAGQLAAVW